MPRNRSSARRAWLIGDVSQKKKVDEVLPELLQVCSSFVPDDRELLYVVLGDFARHLLAMKKDGREDVLRAAASFIERMHVEGEDYVREAATIGALEGIQNVWENLGADPEEFRIFLGGESKRWWDSLNQFWEGKISHVGADLKKG
jgi:hypothetical protein